MVIYIQIIPETKNIAMPITGHTFREKEIDEILYNGELFNLKAYSEEDFRKGNYATVIGILRMGSLYNPDLVENITNTATHANFEKDQDFVIFRRVSGT
ncbi:hypothetical protein COV24_01750 [candidate division WWE3 bacterium CG10_big_fil_rev_8_21_14_0_10_32_10]|uniref:Uncharacterized protein n=1 Tax=candidate division WWE3 bacterium CG10_big_fil_rev_8_21_14_0_10_32_10 TaxID=1975090 RepID=A0A2H0RC67_UNCKA|nr:MAG: hypothetical protein COV24_01750 [candidate division WWE3 bacterium CG10_big_fil_rev_8_21_14_0_10_32_10]